MNATSPFGKYAGIVAAVAALGILGVWLLGIAGVAGVKPSPELAAVAYVVVGVIFGTGAGALVVANGAGRQAQQANTRLDAIHAPTGAVASALVEHAAEAAATPTEPPVGGIG